MPILSPDPNWEEDGHETTFFSFGSLTEFHWHLLLDHLYNDSWLSITSFCMRFPPCFQPPEMTQLRLLRCQKMI